MPSWDNSSQSKVAARKSKFIISTQAQCENCTWSYSGLANLELSHISFYLWIYLSVSALDLKCNMSKEGDDNNKKLRVARTSLCTSCPQRQHHQQETEERQVKIEAATKYRNSNANETDEAREHWLQTPGENIVPLEFATKACNEERQRRLEVYSWNYVLQCNDRQQETNWGQPISVFNIPWATMASTVSLIYYEQSRTSIMCPPNHPK